MNIATINQEKADNLAKNIMMILDGEKMHTVEASLAQVIKTLSLVHNMKIEDVLSDIEKISDILYADAQLERIEKDLHDN